MANPMAQAAISLESHPGGHVYLYERAPVGATRVNCGLIMVARSATLGSWLVGHWDTPGSYLALCVPMLKVSSVSGAGNPVSSSYNSPIIVYNRARGGSISMDRVRCRPSAGAH